MNTRTRTQVGSFLSLHSSLHAALPSNIYACRPGQANALADCFPYKTESVSFSMKLFLLTILFHRSPVGTGSDRATNSLKREEGAVRYFQQWTSRTQAHDLGVETKTVFDSSSLLATGHRRKNLCSKKRAMAMQTANFQHIQDLGLKNAVSHQICPGNGTRPQKTTGPSTLPVPLDTDTIKGTEERVKAVFGAPHFRTPNRMV